MDVGNVIVGVLSALGGGALASFLTFRISLKRQRLTEFEVLIEEYKQMKNALEDKIVILERRVQNLETESAAHIKEVLTRDKKIMELEQKLLRYEKK